MHDDAHHEPRKRIAGQDHADGRGRETDGAAVDRQVEGEELDPGQGDAAHDERAPQRRDREQVEGALRGCRLMPHVLGEQPAMEQDVDAGQSRG